MKPFGRKTDEVAPRDGVRPGLLTRVATRVTRAGMGTRAQTFPLATDEIAGPLQFTSGGLYLWYLLGPLSWDFLTLPERIRLWDQQAYRLGRLAETSPVGGRPLRVRVTTRPYPAYEYARSLDEATPSPLPQAPGGESWDDYLSFGQRRLRSTGLDQKVVAVGVWLGPTPRRRVREELIMGADAPGKETLACLDQIGQVDKIMTGAGMDAVRASGRDLAFLMHRSMSMGCPVPAHAAVGGSRWEATDLAEFVDRRMWLSDAFAPTVRIHSEVRGAAVERHVAVVTMGAMPDRHWPESGQDPWLLSSSRLPFPVEWSLSGVLLRSSGIAAAAVFEQNRAEGIRKHYDEHDVTPPPAVDRAIRGAAMNLDEITAGDTRSAPRWAGTVRAAVYGGSEDETLRRVRELVDHYGERMRMQLASTKDQAQALREFVPGEPAVRHGWQRRMSVRYMASAMPNVDSELGTPTGPYFAYGIGSARRAARFDMHYGPEVRNAPGLFPIAAEPGAGKSVLIGALAYNAVRAGEHTIILDPSGPLAKLCDLPELAPFSRVLDLTKSEPGTLSPFRLIPEPQPNQVRDTAGLFDEVEYARSKRRARAERQQLMFDVLRMWLPSGTLRLPGVDVLLREAIREVGQDAEDHHVLDAQINPRWVLNWLTARASSGSDDARLAAQIASEVKTAAEFPLGELIMPPHSETIRETSIDDATLVVVTMPGLYPPPEDVSREHWGSEERYTQPLLHLAAFFASRFIYGRERSERKNVFLDENHLMGQWGSGRAFFVRLSRDSRKWNTAIGAASQHPDDHLTIGRVDALTGGAFVGRLRAEDAALAGTRLLQCPPEYAPVLQSLSAGAAAARLSAANGDDPGGAADDARHGQTGEFVWRDPLGRLGKIRVDMDWHPSLRKALVTTPGRKRPKGRLEYQPTPFIDPDLFDGIQTLPIPDGVAA